MGALGDIPDAVHLGQGLPLGRSHTDFNRRAPLGARATRGVRGPWFPEPLLDDPYEDPERSAELADSVSMAALLLLERLSPLERAVFVLREVFGFDFPEIASAVQRSEAAC